MYSTGAWMVAGYSPQWGQTVRGNHEYTGEWALSNMWVLSAGNEKELQLREEEEEEEEEALGQWFQHRLLSSWLVAVRRREPGARDEDRSFISC